MSIQYYTTGGHTMDTLWIPKGKHYGLNITTTKMADSGDFTGGGWKVIWHTTEGHSIAGAAATLRANMDAPHFIIDPRTGRCIQVNPLDKAGRALQHTGGPETNRANAIQVEIVGLASESGGWSRQDYLHLAALALLIEHRRPVPRRTAAGVSFRNPRKMSATGFVRAAGHAGHVHVPGNNHTDPGTGFDITRLFRLIDEV